MLYVRLCTEFFFTPLQTAVARYHYDVIRSLAGATEVSPRRLFGFTAGSR